MEVEHAKLLRKIEGINKDLTQAKIGFSKYWIESSYKDASGKSNKEYQINKRGCEFLAHKTTGTKGNLFTDRYMDRFEQMKQQLSDNPIGELSTENVLKLLGDSNLLVEIVQAVATMAIQQHIKAFEELNKTKGLIINELEKKNIELSNEGARILKEFNDNQAVIDMLKGNKAKLIGEVNGQVQRSS
jgi:phage regulator Rha-like protein